MYVYFEGLGKYSSKGVQAKIVCPQKGQVANILKIFFHIDPAPC